MALRFSTKNILIPPTGLNLAHGLPTTADEYFVVPRSGPAISGVWMVGTVVDATTLYLTANSTNTVDVFAAVNHSIVR